MQTAEQIEKISALHKAINKLSSLEKYNKVENSLLEYAKLQMPSYQTPAQTRRGRTR